MKKLKVVHIHDDPKFINRTNRFDDDRFDNKIIFIGSSRVLCENKYDIDYFGTNKKEIEDIINHCNSASLVVVYDLNFIKSYIINRISSEVKVGWTFFGYELYKRMPEKMFSKSSLSLLEIRQNPDYPVLKRYFLKAKAILKKILLGRLNSEKEFFKAMNRVDHFFLLSDYEYSFLKSFWPNLPSFFQAPATSYGDNKLSLEVKVNNIIIGNNRSPYNNHLDVFEIISKIKNIENVRFKVFLSYGSKKDYYKVVMKKAGEIEEIDIIEDFLEIDEFENIYKKASAFVMNGYRQMAYGNIFMGLRNGVKIYLNSNNVYFTWLIKEGFLIYNINDLANDIENDDFKLSYDEMKYNFKQCDILFQRYNVYDFCDNIYKDLTVNA